jgi:hypothetical protein
MAVSRASFSQRVNPDGGGTSVEAKALATSEDFSAAPSASNFAAMCSRNRSRGRSSTHPRRFMALSPRHLPGPHPRHPWTEGLDHPQKPRGRLRPPAQQEDTAKGHSPLDPHSHHLPRAHWQANVGRPGRACSPRRRVGERTQPGTYSERMAFLRRGDRAPETPFRSATRAAQRTARTSRLSGAATLAAPCRCAL